MQIPVSQGVAVRPTTQTEIASPDSQLTQILPRAIEGFGNNLLNTGVQLQYAQSKEDDAFNAAQVIDFKTQLAKFENEKRVALNDLSPNDPKEIATVKQKFLDERNKFVSDFATKYKDNTRLNGLINQQAKADSVDFEYDADRILSNKRQEYGKNKIYESIYGINQSLEKGGNVAKLSRQLNETLQVGLKAGLIDQQDIIRETEKQKGLIKELEDEYQKNQYANLIASGQIKVDPFNSDDKKLGDLAFEKVMANANKGGKDLETTAQNFALQTNYVPARMKQVWSAQLTSGSPQQRVATAGRIAELINVNPRLADQFNSDDISFVNAIKTRVDTGLSADQIIKYSETEINKMQSLDVKAKTDIYNNADYKKTRDKEYKALLADLQDEPGFDFFKSTPELDDKVKASFDSLVKDSLINSPSSTKEGAIEYAKTQIRSQYAVSDIGKRKIMRYAPETFFRQYGDTSWIKEQFKAKVAEHSLSASVNDVGEKFDIAPVPNKILQGQPSYYIIRQDEYGGQDILRDGQNQPVIFTPDINKADFFVKQQQEAQKIKGSVPSKSEMLDYLKGIKNKEDVATAINEGAKNRF